MELAPARATLMPFMLKALKGLFDAPGAPMRPVPGLERRPLQLAVAALLHEAARSDYHEGDRGVALLAVLRPVPQPPNRALPLGPVDGDEAA